MPKTPIKGVHMSGDDRDLRALKERRATSQSDATIRSAEVHDEVTSPHDLIEIERDKYDSDRHYREEMNAINARYQADPAFRALWNLMRRQRRESNRTMGTIANAASEVHHDMHDVRELTDQLKDIVNWQNRVDTTLSITKWVLGFVLAATLGSVIVIASKI